MTAATDYLEVALLSHVLSQSAYAMPTDVFASLHTASPTDTGSRAAEVSTAGSGYARQSIKTKMTTPHPTLGRSTNSSVITMGPALTDWGTITHLGIDDDATAGNMLLWAQSSTARTVTIGESFQLIVGQLAITLA